MAGESGVTRSIIDELHPSDIQGDEMEGERRITPKIIDEFYSWDIQRHKMGGESGVTRRIIHELHLLRYPRKSNGRSKWCYTKCHS